MNYAYIRVSTSQQNTATQHQAISKYCNQQNIIIHKVFEEKISGENTNRPKLQEMLETIVEGDSIYALDFSRLSRSSKDLLELYEQIIEKKKCEIICINNQIDASNITGKMVLTLLAAINEMQKSTINQRQAEGVAFAIANGVKFGRKPTPKPPNWDIIIRQYLAKTISAKEAMEILGIKKTLFYSLLKREEGIKPKKKLSRIVKPINFNLYAKKYIIGSCSKEDVISKLGITKYAFDKLYKQFKAEELYKIELMEAQILLYK